MAVECVSCGKKWSDEKQYCVVCGASTRAEKVRGGLGASIIVAVASAALLTYILASILSNGGDRGGPTVPTNIPTNVTSSRSEQTSPFTDEAFNEVKAVFEKAGARVERDLSPPGGRTIRIYLPLSTAMEMTELQANTAAEAAKARLGEKAIVYIKGPGGNTIGKSSL